MLTRIGTGVVFLAREIRELWLVYIGALAGLVRGGRARRRGDVVRQMFAIGNRSVVFVVVTLGFIGMVMTYEACLQLKSITGNDFSQVGPQLVRLIISDFGPTLAAMM